MDQELRGLFDLRSKERGRVLREQFLRVKQEMNARGVLNSIMTIQSAHKAMTEELKTERHLVSETIIDFVGNTQRVTSASLFHDISQAELASRKTALEDQLASEFTDVLSGLPNSSMTAPFLNLNEIGRAHV